MAEANGLNSEMIPLLTLTRENINQIRKTDTVSSNGRVAILTKVTSSTILERVMEKCSGMMALAIMVSGNKTFRMAWAN
jgi:hypothetical protein